MEARKALGRKKNGTNQAPKQKQELIGYLPQLKPAKFGS